MIDQPKRRGRPPKVMPQPALSAEAFRRAVQAGGLEEGGSLRATGPFPTLRLRHKPGVGLQQAWQHATGQEWRPVPTVAADAADWEDA